MVLKKSSFKFFNWLGDIIKENIKYPIIGGCLIIFLYGVKLMFHIDYIKGLSFSGLSMDFGYEMNKEITNFEIRIRMLEDRQKDLRIKPDSAQASIKYKSLVQAQSIKSVISASSKQNEIDDLILNKDGYIFLGSYNSNRKDWDILNFVTNRKYLPTDFNNDEVYIMSRSVVLNQAIPTEKDINNYRLALGVIPSGGKIKILNQPEVQIVDDKNYYWIKVLYIKK